MTSRAGSNRNKLSSKKTEAGPSAGLFTVGSEVMFAVSIVSAMIALWFGAVPA
jgi:hypothetical protein